MDSDSFSLNLFHAFEIKSTKHRIWNLCWLSDHGYFLDYFQYGLFQDHYGFQFDVNNGKMALAELYIAQKYNVQSKLTDFELPIVILNDVIELYANKVLNLLGKYFIRLDDKYTFIWSSDEPLYISGESKEEAKQRIQKMKTIQRKRSKSTIQIY